MRQVNMHIEGVPNPNAIKFVLENGVLAQEEYEYTDFKQTQSSPLARKIMMLKYVERVLLHQNYITVLKRKDATFEWETVLPELKEMITSHLQANEPILYVGAESVKHNKTGDEVMELVERVLNQSIRIAAQEDGGDLLIKSYENGILTLKMVGACHGCPYAVNTVKQGVEPALMGLVPEIKEVRW